MALCIKEQVFSSVKKYTITDESGQLRYTTEGRAKGQFIVVGNQIHIFDPLGNEVAFVHKVLSFFHPKYELIIHGEKKGTIIAKTSIFHPRYLVDFMSYRIDGKILGWHFDIYQKDRLVAQVEPQMISIGSIIHLSCPNPEDELPSLLLAIAIDLIGLCTNIGFDFN